MPWSIERARAWYARQSWPLGFNFLPSTAVNSTEMWQAETFDPVTIDRELGWAADRGFNACRVFLQFLVWEADPAGMQRRLHHFLTLAAGHGISTTLIFFDDCAFAGKQPYLGPQDAPAPYVHNSAWTPSPGRDAAQNPALYPRLQAYVQDLMYPLAHDPRVLAWDLYNEPSNSDPFERSLPLLERAFAWAREVNPSQPLTTAIWRVDEKLAPINEFLQRESDILSFHNYTGRAQTAAQIAELAAHGRPLFCTEWMARTYGSTYPTHLPLFRTHRVGCFAWGLVNGKTQTHYPWGWGPGQGEPPVWGHDLLRSDGTPHNPADIVALRAAAATLNA